MPDKDYYIMLSMIETIDKIIRYTRDYKSGDWDPLGEDCGNNKSCLREAKNIYF